MDKLFFNKKRRKITKKKDNAFTLVEVIVIAVILAILAVLSVQIYSGYVQDSRQKVADHVAAAAAGFLMAAENFDIDVDELEDVLTPNKAWNVNLTSGLPSIFKCPVDVVITKNNGNKTVKATVKTIESREYKYSQ